MKKISVTNLLILSFIGVFLFETLYAEKIAEIFSNFGFSLNALLHGRWWVLLTSIFLHASPEHLALNILALFFFGNAVEEKLGAGRTLSIFFLSALSGEALVLVLSVFGLQSPFIPTIGASAGIFGLMGTAMLVKPFEFIVYPYLIPFPIFLVALVYTLSNFLLFIYQVFTGTESEISYAAHVGGVLFGIYAGLKESREKKAVIVLLILLTLIAFPFIWEVILKMESFNYVSVLTGVLK